MSISQITDHEDRMLSLLPTQFRNKPVIEAIISAFAAQIQELEDSAWKLGTLRALDVATGAQLDGSGEILGEERKGRSDTNYRAALKVRITINLSSGEPETLINVYAALTGSSSVGYSEFYPAGAQLNGVDGTIPADLLANMYAVAPAAVELILTISTATPFGFAGDPNAYGFGSTVDPSEGGELSGVVS